MPRPLIEETWVAGSNPASSRGDTTLPGRPAVAGRRGSRGLRRSAGLQATGSGPRTQIAGRHSGGQRAVRQQEVNEAIAADARLTEVGYLRGTMLGALQIFALLPGISRDGVVMVGGMFRGLSRQDAARFSFLLSAPVILAAGALKLGELTGPGGDGIRGQVLAGSIVSGVSAFLALRFLMRYLQDQLRHADAVRDLLPRRRHRQRRVPVHHLAALDAGRGHAMAPLRVPECTRWHAYGYKLACCSR